MSRVPMMLAVWLAAAAPVLAADGLQPHRASYEVKLESANPAADLTAVSGRMVVEFQDVCDGHASNQRFVTRMTSGDGTTTVNDYQATAWEARDGGTFRFSNSNALDGEIFEAFTGAATGSPDSAGEAVYDQPKSERLELPPGIVFPVRHLALLVEAAKAGQASLSVTVFDGVGPAATYRASAFIGGPLDNPEAEGAEGADGLLGLRAWPVILAYYPASDPDALPEYEVAFRLFENGVATAMTMNYEEFSLTARLDRLEYLARPRC